LFELLNDAWNNYHGKLKNNYVFCYCSETGFTGIIWVGFPFWKTTWNIDLYVGDRTMLLLENWLISWFIWKFEYSKVPKMELCFCCFMWFLHETKLEHVGIMVKNECVTLMSTLLMHQIWWVFEYMKLVHYMNLKWWSNFDTWLYFGIAIV
jgi:hypothetical protein